MTLPGSGNGENGWFLWTR